MHIQNEISSTVDVLEHRGFACMYVRRYLTQASRLGYTQEDLEQTAMLALCVAAQRYDPAKGAFTTWAANQLRLEMNKLVYKDPSNKKRELIQPDILFTDITHIDQEGNELRPLFCELHSDEDAEEMDYWVQKFIMSAKLSELDRYLLILIYLEGQEEATKRFMKKQGITRQAVNHRLVKLRRELQQQYFSAINPKLVFNNNRG